MSCKKTNNFTDEYWAVVVKGKKLEELGTEFLREHGYNKFGKKQKLNKQKRSMEHYTGYITSQSTKSR